MTKINKAGKSTFVIAILSFLLVAVLAFGGTYAYFSANTNPAGGTITMGALHVYLKDEDSAVLSGSTALGTITIAQPNQEILNTTYSVDLTDTKTSTINAFVRVKVEAALTSLTVKDGKFENIPAAESAVTPTTLFTISAGDGWYQHTDGYAYYVAAKNGKDSVLKELTPATPASLPISIVVNKNVGNGGSTFFMGATGTFSISVEAIQADYLDDIDNDDTEYTVEKIVAAWSNVVNGTYVKPTQN